MPPFTPEQEARTGKEPVQINVHTYPKGFDAVAHGICLGVGLTLGVVAMIGLLAWIARLMGAA